MTSIPLMISILVRLLTVPRIVEKCAFREQRLTFIADEDGATMVEVGMKSYVLTKTFFLFF